jgi:hypothetical protein
MRCWLSLTLVVLVGLSCSKSDAKSDTLVTGASTAAPTPQINSPSSANVSGKHATFVVDTADLDSPVLANKPAGTLPLGTIDKYENSAREFRNFAHSRSWLGWERKRKCQKNAPCESFGGAGTAQVLVQAIEDAHEVGSADIPDDADVLIARVTNYGPSGDPRLLNCAPPTNENGDTQCYVILHRERPGGGVQLRYARLDGGSDSPKLTILPESDGYYTPCPVHPMNKRHFAAADFAGCPTQQTTASRPASDPSLLSGMWLSCAEGCCTAAYPIELALAEMSKARNKE